MDFVTILRDTVTTSWSADDICFLILNISCWFRHLGFVCVHLYIARSGLLQIRETKTDLYIISCVCHASVCRLFLKNIQNEMT